MSREKFILPELTMVYGVFVFCECRFAIVVMEVMNLMASVQTHVTYLILLMIYRFCRLSTKHI